MLLNTKSVQRGSVFRFQACDCQILSCLVFFNSCSTDTIYVFGNELLISNLDQMDEKYIKRKSGVCLEHISSKFFKIVLIHHILR